MHRQSWRARIHVAQGTRRRPSITETTRPPTALPAHFSPHCLRHTFASLLLQQGESPAYVQRQLGHASIQLTVDTYGKWLPMGNKPAVNRLDEPSGSKVVAKKESEVPDTAETPDSIGGPSRTRTLDPLIKRPFPASFRLSHSNLLHTTQCHLSPRRMCRSEDRAHALVAA